MVWPFLTTFPLRQCHEGRNRHLRRPHFSKWLTKLAIFPDYKRSGMLCLALPARRKVRKLDFQSEFSMSKIIRIFLNFFFIEANQRITVYQCHEGHKRHLWRPHFSKWLTKLAIFPDYKRPRMLYLALPARHKVQKLDFQR